MREAFRFVGVFEQQSAEMVQPRRKVIAVGLADEEHLIDAVRQQDVVQFVEAAEFVVAFERDVPAKFPPTRQREQTARLETAAPSVDIF